MPSEFILVLLISLQALVQALFPVAALRVCQCVIEVVLNVKYSPLLPRGEPLVVADWQIAAGEVAALLGPVYVHDVFKVV
mmetsp:Transcript_5398/g.8360  ORF Transcript_5398/g.8360 Transcript_5398/m.8360 type:complete len:80 (-) Transcript_5398:33-272(-)